MKRGPEIKMPKFLADLYSDLRDQRLLPLVIVLLVAIPVVPIVFNNPTPTFVPPAADEGLAANMVDDSLMVVSAPAGLRRHGERFAGRQPRDPFVDPRAPKGSAKSDNSANRTDTEVDVVIEEDANGDDLIIEEVPVGNPGSSGRGGSPDKTVIHEETVKLFRLKTSLRFGKAGSGLLYDFPDVSRMRGLPKQEPIAVFIGSSEDASRAVFSISADASRVTGEGTCSTGKPKNCQFLTLRPGKAANIHDARRGVIWRLAVSSIELVETDIEVLNESGKGGGTGRGSKPGADPIGPDVVEAASLSEVIGLYLLK